MWIRTRYTVLQFAVNYFPSSCFHCLFVGLARILLAARDRNPTQTSFKKEKVIVCLLLESPRLQAEMGPSSTSLSIFVRLFSLASFSCFPFRQLEKKAVCILARWSSQHVVQDKEKSLFPPSAHQMLGKMLMKYYYGQVHLIGWPGLVPSKEGNESDKATHLVHPWARHRLAGSLSREHKMLQRKMASENQQGGAPSNIGRAQASLNLAL